MHTTRTLLISSLVLASATAIAEAGQVRIWPSAVVVGSEITLGDLCDLSGFDAETEAMIRSTPIQGQPGPPPGGSVLVSIEQIHRTLRAAGVNLATTTVSGASRCGVRRIREVAPAAPKRRPQARAGPVSSGRSLRDAVGDYLETLIQRHDGRVELQFGRTAASVLDLAEPEFQFVIHRRSGQILGLVNLEVDIRKNGETVQSVPVVVNAYYRAPVVVARGPINLRAAIGADDVQVVERTFTRIDEIGLSQPAAVVGMRAKRFIPAGTMFTGRELETVPLVRRSQLTRIQSSAGGVTVETVGKAMDDGSFGDLIELRTGGRRGVTVTGMVVGPGRVELSTSGLGEGSRLARR